jgi:maltooligosyltrehalose trehalohydrolase
VLTGPAAGTTVSMRPAGPSSTAIVRGAQAGDRYVYSLDGSEPRPDPASRWQPDGVHAASAVVDPDAYQWQHTGGAAFGGDLVIYELHVGTFTPRGHIRRARGSGSSRSATSASPPWS